MKTQPKLTKVDRMSIQIRKSRKDDVAELQKISRETFRDTFEPYNSQADIENYLQRAYNEATLERELSDEHSEFYFLYDEEEFAGYLKVNIGAAQTEAMGADAMEIQRIYIRKQFKHRGFGTVLFELAFRLAKQKQKSRVWLGVWEKNYPALAFYRKMGFQEAGDHTFLMGQHPQRDLIMVKELV